MLSAHAGSEPRRNAGVRAARPEDLALVLALLEAERLPVEGVAESFADFIVVERGGTIIAAAGLEVVANDCLLRSLVVAPSTRGLGLGQLLVTTLLDRARQLRLDSIWLLTETAATYFSRLGFEARPRDEAPTGLRQTAEFRHCCPASATAMSRAVRQRIMVVCTANRARSQIAEALLQRHLGDRARVASAGTHPGNEPHPLAVAALAELGIDWQGRRCKSIGELVGPWDLVITVCDNALESCPVVPAARTIHWSLPDPEGKKVEAFREIAATITRLIPQV